MRALLIDDEQLVLDGIDAFLQAAWPELTVDKTSSVAVALELAAQVPYRIVLLDWHLVGGDGQPVDGRGVVEALRAAGSAAAILIVSGDDPARCQSLVHTLHLAGFVPKSASGGMLLDALRKALAGGVALPDGATAERARAAAAGRGGEEAPVRMALRQRFPALTERQAEVFSIMVRGAGDKQIARELDVSLNTVRTHVRGVLGAVGVNRRGEAVFRAVADRHD